MSKNYLFRSLAGALMLIVISPMTTSGQYTFGDWASDHGYSPGDVMPGYVDATNSSPSIDNLYGISAYDWIT